MSKNVIFKSTLFLLLIFYVFTGCQKDDEVSPPHSVEAVHDTRVRNINYNEFKTRLGSNKSLRTIDQYFNAKNNSNKSNGENLTVSTVEIVLIETDDVDTYTFRVVSNTISLSFYNLVLEHHKTEDELKTSLLKYTPEVEWMLNPDDQFFGSVVVEDVENVQIDLTDFPNVQKAGCLDVTGYWICDAGNIGHHPGHPDCQVGGNVFIIHFAVIACDQGGGGGIWSPNPTEPISDPDPWNGGNNNGGGGGTSGGNTVILGPCSGDGNYGGGGGNNEPCLEFNAYYLYQQFLGQGINLTFEQVEWIFENTENHQIALQMLDLLQDDGYSDEAIIATQITLSTLAEGMLYYNTYFNIIHQYVDFNSTYDPVWAIYFSTKCAIIKAQNPIWPDWKVYWEASREIVHLALDLGGLVPVVGEVCDVVNGVIYTIEGDGVNASLSFAAAIPIAGWFSTGAKFAYKGTNKFVVKANNIIDFGNRKYLRKNLGLAVGNPQHAHHIIPWDFRSYSIVQKAAKSNNAFHMNEVLNGIPLPSTNHLTGHNLYSNKIESIFK